MDISCIFGLFIKIFIFMSHERKFLLISIRSCCGVETVLLFGCEIKESNRCISFMMNINLINNQWNYMINLMLISLFRYFCINFFCGTLVDSKTFSSYSFSYWLCCDKKLLNLTIFFEFFVSSWSGADSFCS